MKFSAAFSKFMFYFGNIIIGIIFVSSLIWIISASLKPEALIFANMNSIKTFFPASASLSNYVEVFTRMNLPQVFKNTLLYIALILVLDLLVNSMCGYALAKFDFKGKGLVMNLVVALMVLPMEAIMLPLYIEMSQLGWVNTLAALVIPFPVFGLNLEYTVSVTKMPASTTQSRITAFFGICRNRLSSMGAAT